MDDCHPVIVLLCNRCIWKYDKNINKDLFHNHFRGQIGTTPSPPSEKNERPWINRVRHRIWHNYFRQRSTEVSKPWCKVSDATTTCSSGCLKRSTEGLCGEFSYSYDNNNNNNTNSHNTVQRQSISTDCIHSFFIPWLSIKLLVKKLGIISFIIGRNKDFLLHFHLKNRYVCPKYCMQKAQNAECGKRKYPSIKRSMNYISYVLFVFSWKIVSNIRDMVKYHLTKSWIVHKVCMLSIVKGPNSKLLMSDSFDKK